MPRAGRTTGRPRGTTAERGLGSGHQALREQLLPAAYGQPCPGPWQGRRSPRCTQVMVDRRLMDLDDRVPRMLGGRSTVTGGRICCSPCNRSAGGRMGAMVTNARRRRVRLPVW